MGENNGTHYLRIEVNGEKLDLGLEEVDAASSTYFVLSINHTPAQTPVELRYSIYKELYQPSTDVVKSSDDWHIPKWYYWFAARDIHSIEIESTGEPGLNRLTIMPKEGEIRVEILHVEPEGISFDSEPLGIYDFKSISYDTAGFNIVRVTSTDKFELALA